MKLDATQSATKIASSCVTKIACVNGALCRHRTQSFLPKEGRLHGEPKERYSSSEVSGKPGPIVDDRLSSTIMHRMTKALLTHLLCALIQPSPKAFNLAPLSARSLGTTAIERRSGRASFDDTVGSRFDRARTPKDDNGWLSSTLNMLKSR